MGPNKLEVDSPVFPGNSGGPIFHLKNKQVIGLLTKASVVSLNATIRNLSTRTVKEINARKKQLTFAQLKDLEELEQISGHVVKQSDVLARDIETVRVLLQKNGR